MAVYVWRDGAWRDKRGKAMMLPPHSKITLPSVISDIPEYRSPIDGKPITSRSARREDLRRNGCIDANELPSPTRGLFKNKAFCAKRGFQVSEEFR